MLHVIVILAVIGIGVVCHMIGDQPLAKREVYGLDVNFSGAANFFWSYVCRAI